MSTPTSPPLSARAVTVTSAGRHRLAEVDLDLPAGHVHAIIGPNGSGKSTLLATLAGEIETTSGSVLLGGRPVRALPPDEAARSRALLDQEIPMAFAFTVAEVVSWGRLPWRGRPESSDDKAILRDVCEQHALTHLLTRPVPTLSAGERARVHLARVLAQRAPVLLLDEPDAALDLAGREHLAAAVRRCRDRGDSVVLVGHGLNWISSLADSITVLSEGRVVAQGPGIVTAELVKAVFGVRARVVSAAGRQLIVTD